MRIAKTKGKEIRGRGAAGAKSDLDANRQIHKTLPKFTHTEIRKSTADFADTRRRNDYVRFLISDFRVHHDGRAGSRIMARHVRGTSAGQEGGCRRGLQARSSAITRSVNSTRPSGCSIRSSDWIRHTSKPTSVAGWRGTRRRNTTRPSRTSTRRLRRIDPKFVPHPTSIGGFPGSRNQNSTRPSRISTRR